MNKEQIKRELRRSACEDADPWHECNDFAWEKAFDDFLLGAQSMAAMPNDDLRTFYLLVAEAL